jgi:hypothetical protein
VRAPVATSAKDALQSAGTTSLIEVIKPPVKVGTSSTASESAFSLSEAFASFGRVVLS